MRQWRWVLVLALFWPMLTSSAGWVRPGREHGEPVWGIKGGLQFALPPGGFTGGEGGPRGLIRLGYPVLPDGGYDLINFIAVEPVVVGQRGYSELEESQLDGTQGKRLWAPTEGEADGRWSPGKLTRLEDGVEELEVTVRVERFKNGARVRLVLRQRSDRPDELALTVYREEESAPLDSCILTATMGNKARTRLLWLGDGVVSSHALFGGYEEAGFTKHAFFGLGRLWRTPEGDALAMVANDEDTPHARQPFGRPSGWDYRGRKVTQYWRMPNPSDKLRLALNARYTYWQSRRPIPGGIAFENFELQEPFREGQTFVFGISEQTPERLLFPAPREPHPVAAEEPRRPRPGGPEGPGPWDNDVLVFRVDADGQARAVATFPRAGVATIAQLSDGRLIAAHQHFPENPPEDFDKVAVRFSSDQGTTWTDPAVIGMNGLPDGMRFPFDPTLVPLPDGRIRLYFTSLLGRQFEKDTPSIFSAVSEDGLQYEFEPGRRFGVADRIVIDCAVVLHRGVFHLYCPDNGAVRRPGDPREEERRGPGRAYHAVSMDGLTFTREEDVTLEGAGNWLGCAQSDGERITFYGTGTPRPAGRGGGLWRGTSHDGSAWQLVDEPLRVPGADPGVVRLADGTLIVVATGRPRMRPRSGQ